MILLKGDYLLNKQLNKMRGTSMVLSACTFTSMSNKVFGLRRRWCKGTVGWDLNINIPIFRVLSWLGLCHNTLTPARTPRLWLCDNILTPARTPRLGLCHNTLTPARTPRLGLCHNTLTPAGTPGPWLCDSILTPARTPGPCLCHNTLTPVPIPGPWL